MYSGGPSGPPNFNPKLILMSRDPVACDKQGQNVINVEREKMKLFALMGLVAASRNVGAALVPAAGAETWTT